MEEQMEEVWTKQDARGRQALAEGWPWLTRVAPGTLMGIILAWLGLAWALFLLVDILGVLPLRIGGPVWPQLFNERPVEWSQWVILAWAVPAAGFLGGRLQGSGLSRHASFFHWLSFGLALMLVEEAGDVRHTISAGVGLLFGTEIAGLPHRVVSDVPYFALLAACPLYAVLRYGRDALQSRRARGYLVSGVLLYAAVALANGLRHLGDLYIHVGAWLDRAVLGARFPVPSGMTVARAHFMVMDAVIEESLELLAASLMLAAILAFVADLRAGWEPASDRGRP